MLMAIDVAEYNEQYADVVRVMDQAEIMSLNN